MRRILPLALMLLTMAGCGPRPAASVRIDPALATLIPQDTVLLAGARLDALRGTPLYRKLGPDALGPLLGGVEAKDVWEVLAASNGRDTAFMARGKFSPMGLEPEPSRPGGTRTSYKGYTLVGGDEATLTFLNPTTALAGRAAAVRAVLDQRGKSTGPPAALATEIAAIPPANQIWIAGLGEASRAVPHHGNLGNIATALGLVERFRVGADLRTGVQVTATANCRSPQDAASLAAALQGFLAFARLGSPQDRDVIAAIHVTSDQQTVKIDGTVPEAWVAGMARGR
jgi:hypothetical protein